MIIINNPLLYFYYKIYFNYNKLINQSISLRTILLIAWLNNKTNLF
jgi:hypothetical protein